MHIRRSSPRTSGPPVSKEWSEGRVANGVQVDYLPEQARKNMQTKLHEGVEKFESNDANLEAKSQGLT